MEEQPIKVLLVEDDEDDYILTRDLLAGNGRTSFALEWVSTYAGGLQAIQHRQHAVCLIDYRLGEHTGIELVDAARQLDCQMPLILLTGQGNADVDLQAMLAGATDYLVKGQFDGPALERVIRYALERQRIQAEIREKEARFRLIARATHDAVWDWNIQQHEVWHSDGFRHFGYAPPEVGKTFDWWFSKVHPDDRAGLMSSVEAAIKSPGEIWQGEYRFRRKDGSWAHIFDRAFVLRDEAGVAQRMVGAMMDISGRKRAEEKIREQAGLLDKAHDAIIVRDLNQRITYWSQGAERIYGWTADEACVTETSGLPAKDDSPQFQEANRITLEKGEWQGELRQQTKDGREIIVSSSRTLMRDAQGRPKAIFAINTDITEQKRLEAQFLRSQRMDSIGALAGGIAHDLNNALAPIAMASEFLRMTNRDPEKDRLLASIQDSAKRGAGMVRQILTFARGAEAERGVVQVKPLVREMADLAGHTFAKAIEIRTAVASDIWPLVGHPTQLHQILLNLCVNARDAMPRGGTLTLAAGNVRLRLDDACTRISPEAKPGPYVVLTVTDTGTGMLPEVRARIFDPFFTTKAPDRGTGLGLSTVNNIVKDHGGFICVRSEPGKGTQFDVYLPAQEAAIAPGEITRIAPPMGKGELILVVDDEASIRGIATQTLETFGYTVLGAGDGAQAVALTVRHLSRLQLMITDMDMPIMDGTATIRGVRTVAPHMKIILASGSLAGNSRMDPTSLAVQAMLDKPYKADDLLRTVHVVLNGNGQVGPRVG